MNRLVDKILILLLSIIAMCLTMHGNTFLVFLYFTITVSAVNYYLTHDVGPEYFIKPVTIKDWCAIIIQLGALIFALLYSPAAVIIPVVIYDVTRSRNYAGLILSILGITNAFISHNTYFSDYGIYIVIYILFLSILSVYLSINSERLALYHQKFNQLRDDSAEKSSKLRSQNKELIQARDNEVYNAQLSERNRIAREIHDNVGHTLSRAILQMGALLAIHKEEPIHSELEGVRTTLDDAMNNIRSSVHDLHDDSIDLNSNIKALAEPLKDMYNLNLEIDVSEDIPRPVKYAIIGITKECISNIIKHSRNTDVDIRLNEHPSIYQLIIHDHSPDSKSPSADVTKAYGHSNEGTRETGMGLENIRGRVESVDGTLNISTENGFRVFVTIPK